VVVRRRRRRTQAGPGLALAIALPAIAAAALAVVLSRPDGSAGRLHGSPAALARLADLTPARPLPSDRRRLHAVVAEPGTAGLRVDPLERLAGGLRPATPARISIPAAGIDAAVDEVRVRRGVIEVPAIGRAGWVDVGPRPGEPGRSVIIGHLDTHRGPGLFARVPKLKPHQDVAVVDARGGVHRYEVVGSAQVEKRSFPAHAVYGPSRRPVLVLITCGGPYRPGKGYRDNVLVYARAA
jgi:sortase family protein